MSEISVGKLIKGDTFYFNNRPFVVLEVRSKHLGRGGAIYRVKMRDLKQGTVLTKAFRPTEKFEEVASEILGVNFLYADGEEAYFINPRTFEQLSLSLDKIGEGASLLKEGENYRLRLVDGEPVDLMMPPKIRRRVIEAPEAVRGNTATAATKWVTVEGNVKVETPLFIKENDMIIIDTRTLTYEAKDMGQNKGGENNEPKESR